MNKLALTVENIRCTYERWGQTVLALDDVNLTVPAGEWLMVAGHNGAGKSTLLKIVAGQIRAFSGAIDIAGRALTAMREKERAGAVYYVHQDPSLGSAPMLTVYENLLIADPSSKGKARRELEQDYTALLCEAGLQSRLHHPAHYLSGGERQLLAFLIARLRPAGLVLLDEPLAAMDAARTALCLRLIEGLREAGKTLLFVTHDLRLAATEGDRAILLSRGRIVYDESGDVRSAERMRALMDEVMLQGAERP